MEKTMNKVFKTNISFSVTCNYRVIIICCCPLTNLCSFVPFVYNYKTLEYCRVIIICCCPLTYLCSFVPFVYNYKTLEYYRLFYVEHQTLECCRLFYVENQSLLTHR